MDIRDIQARAWHNKVAKGFNVSDVAFEFGLLTAEVSEAFTAWRKHLPDLGEELADVALFLVAIAQMNGIDLAEQIERKMAENERRVYHRDDRGVLVKATGCCLPGADPDGSPEGAQGLGTTEREVEFER